MLEAIGVLYDVTTGGQLVALLRAWPKTGGEGCLPAVLATAERGDPSKRHLILTNMHVAPSVEGALLRMAEARDHLGTLALRRLAQAGTRASLPALYAITARTSLLADTWTSAAAEAITAILARCPPDPGAPEGAVGIADVSAGGVSLADTLNMADLLDEADPRGKGPGTLALPEDHDPEPLVSPATPERLAGLSAGAVPLPPPPPRVLAPGLTLAVAALGPSSLWEELCLILVLVVCLTVLPVLWRALPGGTTVATAGWYFAGSGGLIVFANLGILNRRLREAHAFCRVLRFGTPTLATIGPGGRGFNVTIRGEDGELHGDSFKLFPGMPKPVVSRTAAAVYLSGSGGRWSRIVAVDASPHVRLLGNAWVLRPLGVRAWMLGVFAPALSLATIFMVAVGLLYQGLSR